MKKKLLCLLLSICIIASTIIMTLTPARAVDYEYMDCVLSELDNIEKSTVADSEQFKNFKNICFKYKEEMQAYIDCTNNIVTSENEIIQLSPVKNLEDISKTLSAYFSFLKIKANKNPEGIYKHKIEDVKCDIAPHAESQLNLQKVIRESFSKFKNIAADENLGSSIQNIEYILNNEVTYNFIEDLNIILSSSAENDVVNCILLDIAAPNKYSINLLEQIYPILDKSCQANIYRHLSILANIGNKLALNAKNRLMGNFDNNPNIDTINIENLSKEQKNDILNKNKALDASYNEFLKETYGDHYKEFFNEQNWVESEWELLSDLYGYEYRKDLMGCNNIDDYSPWYYNNEMCNIDQIPSYGWKIHVSAQPDSAKKILESLLPYLSEKKINYKICSSLAILRNLNTNLESPTQAGKFITIYCINDNQANVVSTDLDTLISKKIELGELNKNDFCELVGDAKLGETGALYTRFGIFKSTFRVERVKINDKNVLCKFWENRNVPLSKQKYNFFEPKVCPFDLKLSFLGQPLDNNAENITDSWNSFTNLVADNFVV